MSKRRQTHRWTIWCAMLLLGALPLLALRVDPRVYEGGRSRDAVARSARNASAIATLMGELRTSMSDMLFIKTQLYLHSGVAYVPHHEAQLLSVEEMAEVDPHHHAHTHDHEHDVCCPHHHPAAGEHGDDGAHHHCHVGEDTVIPPPSQDFRGFIGRLHRQVKPWRDPSRPHLHTDGTELLPWFRIMTITDPHYVMGYTVGGWSVSHHDESAALAFLEEGIRNNPESFQIRLARGFIHLRALRLDPRNRGLLEKVLSDFRDAVRLGVARRPDPALGPPEQQAGWSVFEEQDLWSACQTLVILEQRHGDPAVARELAAQYLVLFPDNQVLANVLQEE